MGNASKASKEIRKEKQDRKDKTEAVKRCRPTSYRIVPRVLLLSRRTHTQVASKASTGDTHTRFFRRGGRQERRSEEGGRRKESEEQGKEREHNGKKQKKTQKKTKATGPQVIA